MPQFLCKFQIHWIILKAMWCVIYSQLVPSISKHKTKRWFKRKLANTSEITWIGGPITIVSCSSAIVSSTKQHWQAISLLPSASVSKQSPSAKPFLWKWVWFAFEWICEKNWFLSERFRTNAHVLKQRQRELGNGLFGRVQKLSVCVIVS